MMKILNLIILFVLISFQALLSADELKLTHPNGGEVLEPRKMTTIQWEGPEISEGYKVEFSSDLGENWTVLDSNISGYEYKWLTPNMELKNCLIRVSQKEYEYIDIEWMKTYGGSASESLTRVIQTNDGNYLLASQTGSSDGDVLSNRGDYDLWLLKVSKTGEIIWSKTYGGNNRDGSTDIKENKDGIIYVTGYSTSTDGDAVGNLNQILDAWVLKLDSEGEVIWSKFYGGSSYDYPNAIICTNDGGSAFAGMTYSSEIPGSNSIVGLWLTKLNSDGDELWSRKYGGSLIEAAYSMLSTPDNGFIITGITLSTDWLTSGNYGLYDILTLKLDKNGEVVWINNNGSWQDDIGYVINETKDKGYIVTGGANANGNDVVKGRGGKEGLTIKFDIDGKKEWSNTYSTIHTDNLLGVNQIADGGYLTSGYTAHSSQQDTSIKYYKGFIYKIDAQGEHEWVKFIDDKLQTTINSQYITKEGDYIFGANLYTYSADSVLLSDNSILLIKAKQSHRPASTALTSGSFSISGPTSIKTEDKSSNRVFTLKQDIQENKLYVELLETKLLKLTLEIYNSVGVLVQQVQMSSSSIALDLSNYITGRYYVSINSALESNTEIFEVVR